MREGGGERIMNRKEGASESENGVESDLVNLFDCM